MSIKEEDLMTHFVQVKMIQFKWLHEGKKGFLDLVEILNDTTNGDIYPTRFVSSLLSGYWNIYKQKIFWTQSCPFIFYMIGIQSFLVVALKDDD